MVLGQMPQEKLLPTPILTLTQTLTLTGGNSLVAPNPKTNPNLDTNPNPNRGTIFLGGAIVRIPDSITLFTKINLFSSKRHISTSISQDIYDLLFTNMNIFY